MGVKVLEWAHRSEQMGPLWAAQTGSLTPQRNDLGWARPETAGRFCDRLGREAEGAPLPHGVQRPQREGPAEQGNSRSAGGGKWLAKTLKSRV